MLLVLDQGRCQYYENGARKRGPQWDHYEEQRMFEDTASGCNGGGGGHEATEVIEEEVEEVDEAELAWMAQQKKRQEFNPDLRLRSGGREASRVHPFDEQPGQEPQELSQGVDPLGSLAVVDSPLSPRFAAVLSEPPTVTAKSSQGFSVHPSRSPTPNSAKALEPHPQSSVVASSASLPTNANQPGHLASSDGLSTLSRVRAVKSRASLSYSVLPTLSTSSYASSNVLTAAPGSSSASSSTSTLLSSAPSTLLNNQSLSHKASGSMTPGSTLYSGGGGATPATPSSPLVTSASGAISSSSMLFPGRKLSLSGLPSKPTSSASALLLNALLKPAPVPTTSQDGASTTTTKSLTRSSTRNDPAQRLKHQWDQKMRSQSVMFMSPSAMAARSRSMLLSPPPMTISGSKSWMRSSVHLLASASADGTDKNWRQQDQRQRRQGGVSESDLDSQHIETEADQEMEEELRQLLDDATTDDPQYQHPNKNKHKKNSSGGSSGRSGLGGLLGVPSVGVEAKKARRALSMVELSASTSASQYKAAVASVLPAGKTKERYKAEASVSFSTMATLASEGMYQWSEFFDI
ncbi:hypothetical protein EC991_009976 [Linnemannia zychae]|nr:hypothetical protein EC991_009976 [Linnemannia zychae]